MPRPNLCLFCRLLRGRGNSTHRMDGLSLNDYGPTYLETKGRMYL